MNEQQGRIKALEAEIEQLQRQWPKHSTPPALMEQLDELEEALAEAKAEAQASDHDDSTQADGSAAGST
jgi:hypothetical protein